MATIRRCDLCSKDMHVDRPYKQVRVIVVTLSEKSKQIRQEKFSTHDACDECINALDVEVLGSLRAG